MEGILTVRAALSTPTSSLFRSGSQMESDLGISSLEMPLSGRNFVSPRGPGVHQPHLQKTCSRKGSDLTSGERSELCSSHMDGSLASRSTTSAARDEDVRASPASSRAHQGNRVDGPGVGSGSSCRESSSLSASGSYCNESSSSQVQESCQQQLEDGMLSRHISSTSPYQKESASCSHTDAPCSPPKALSTGIYNQLAVSADQPEPLVPVSHSTSHPSVGSGASAHDTSSMEGIGRGLDSSSKERSTSSSGAHPSGAARAAVAVSDCSTSSHVALSTQSASSESGNSKASAGGQSVRGPLGSPEDEAAPTNPNAKDGRAAVGGPQACESEATADSAEVFNKQEDALIVEVDHGPAATPAADDDATADGGKTSRKKKRKKCTPKTKSSVPAASASKGATPLGGRTLRKTTTTSYPREADNRSPSNVASRSKAAATGEATGSQSQHKPQPPIHRPLVGLQAGKTFSPSILDRQGPWGSSPRLSSATPPRSLRQTITPATSSTQPRSFSTTGCQDALPRINALGQSVEASPGSRPSSPSQLPRIPSAASMTACAMPNPLDPEKGATANPLSPSSVRRLASGRPITPSSARGCHDPSRSLVSSCATAMPLSAPASILQDLILQNLAEMSTSDGISLTTSASLDLSAVQPRPPMPDRFEREGLPCIKGVASAVVKPNTPRSMGRSVSTVRGASVPTPPRGADERSISVPRSGMLRVTPAPSSPYAQGQTMKAKTQRKGNNFDEEEEARKAKERLQAYKRTQEEQKAKAAEEESSRRRKALEARQAAAAERERHREELYAMNAILQMSEDAFIAQLLKAAEKASSRAVSRATSARPSRCSSARLRPKGSETGELLGAAVQNLAALASEDPEFDSFCKQNLGRHGV